MTSFLSERDDPSNIPCGFYPSAPPSCRNPRRGPSQRDRAADSSRMRARVGSCAARALPRTKNLSRGLFSYTFPLLSSLATCPPSHLVAQLESFPRDTLHASRVKDTMTLQELQLKEMEDNQTSHSYQDSWADAGARVDLTASPGPLGHVQMKLAMGAHGSDDFCRREWQTHHL